MAKLVPYGVTACDVGCDHGFVAIYLVQEQICPKVLAMDINSGPLFRAKEHIQEAGLSSYIETRLSDGIRALNAGEADCMIAAGMGGRLMVRIMEDDLPKLKSMRYLILQPQSELSYVRGFLRKQGFVIRKEDMVFEDGKFYPMMLVEMGESVCRRECGSGSELVEYSGQEDKIWQIDWDGQRDKVEQIDRSGCRDKAGQTDWNRQKYKEKTGDSNRYINRKKLDCGSDSESRNAQEYQAGNIESLEDEFGPCLIRDKHPVLLQYLAWWEKQQNKILKAAANHPARKAEVEEELERIAAVRKWMDS